MKNHKYLWKYLKPYDPTQSESQGIYKSVKCFYALFIFIYDVLYVIKKQIIKYNLEMCFCCKYYK